MDRQGISFTLGQRLKILREEYDLSHVDLAKLLNERYGISISRDSLMAYEIADETRAKASKLPNLGMRVEYLYCLADLFGVSVDYLLGKTHIRNADADVKEISEKTGLPEKIIEVLVVNQTHTKPSTGEHLFSMEGVNYILEKTDAITMMILFKQYTDCTKRANEIISSAKKDIFSFADEDDRSARNDKWVPKIVSSLEKVRCSRLEIVDYLTDILREFAKENGVDDKSYGPFHWPELHFEYSDE